MVGAFLAILALAPCAFALTFSGGDSFISYFVVSGSPDVARPGDTAQIRVTGKLVLPGQPDILHIAIYADTTSGIGSVVTEGDLMLPGDATEASSQYSVALPLNVINNTYLYLKASDGTRSYSKIPVTLIQNPTYSELLGTNKNLQAQVGNLTSQVETLKSDNSTLTVLLYVAVAVTVIFILTTFYIIVSVVRTKAKAPPAT